MTTLDDATTGVAAAGGVVDAVVGRQRIVDAAGAVVGYELLFRPLPHEVVDRTGDQMTAATVLGALTVGLERLAHRRLLFCNAERGVLVGDVPLVLPPASTVIEIVATVEIDDEVVAGCRRLRAAGFRLALDDPTWGEGVERLLPLVSYVKVDLASRDRQRVLDLVAHCAGHDVCLVAQKVENSADLEWASAHGFTYFQGYHVERPRVVRARTVSPSEVSRLRLAALVMTHEFENRVLAEIVSADPGLLLQLLNLASVGADHGLRRRVETITDALVLLGTTRVRQWAGLLLLLNEPGAVRPALVNVLTRAKACELLAAERGVAVPASAYLVGMLSALELLLGRSIEELADLGNLDASLRGPLLRHEGVLGALVDEVHAYEQSLTSPARPLAARRRPAPDLDLATARAFAWASEMEATVRSV